MVTIRSARIDDAEAIRTIYNVEVITSTSVFDLEPRSLEDQRRWLEDRSGAHAVLVAVDGDRVVGFGSLSRFKERPAYNTTVEDSVYVDRDHHGRGIGRILLEALIDTARGHGFHTMIGRITADNTASIALHRAAGFDSVGLEREIGRKFGRWLDVVVMQKMLRDADGPGSGGSQPKAPAQ
ncbi:MAG: GNAT family N-acetyltransferase [Acidimicrobiales bacterium]